MRLAMFDLDNTLIAGDSDTLWGAFLARKGLVERERHRQAHARFYRDYLEGNLDIDEFLRFQLHFLSTQNLSTLLALRAQYIERQIRPILLPKARQLVERHRSAGDTLLIITATNRFITEPIAALLGIEHLIATEPEMKNGAYTGLVAGTPSFAGGKVSRYDEWLQNHELTPAETWFYSDSHNDLPLLNRVDNPVAVDPDDILKAEACARKWPILTLR